jgi:hypothetical protein
MPIYHFNLADHTYEPDAEGTELADEATARTEAVKFAGAYLADNPDLLAEGARFEVQVVSDDDLHLFTVAIEARNGP